jgi:hypothetical protein
LTHFTIQFVNFFTRKMHEQKELPNFLQLSYDSTNDGGELRTLQAVLAGFTCLGNEGRSR